MAVKSAPLSPKERSELVWKILVTDFRVPGQKANTIKEIMRTDPTKWDADKAYGFAQTAGEILASGKIFDVIGPSLAARIITLPFTAGIDLIAEAGAYQTVAMRSAAYKVTAWAFNHGTPKPSQFVRHSVTSFGHLDGRGRQAALNDANKAWGEASDDTAARLNRLVRQGFKYDEKAAKEFLKIVGHQNPATLCRMILRGFEEILKNKKMFGFIPGRGENSAEYQGFKSANDSILYPK